MPTDILRAYANERVDLVDFDFLADSGFQENLRQPMEEFFTDPAGQRAWILDGFTIANPSGDQVEVTKGRAILGQREGALVFYGALTVEGDATKIIDMTSLTPNANYGLYLRFEYVDGDTSSRIFWNPAGTGSEVAQAVATRRKANWSIRIELTNPGSEYLKIATLDNTGIGVAITDERPLYFEGDVHNSYQSGWSSDGGGTANDRNADRQQYGVKDFQTFTQAMRQCLEDIRGRGLRRWWERDIGGMNIGFDAAPVEDRLAVHDINFRLQHDGTDPYLVWGIDDYFWYDRSSNLLQLVIATNPMLQIGTSGSRLTGLAIAGNLGVVPADDQIRVGDTNFGMLWDGTDPYIYFASTDYLFYDRSANEYHFYIASDKKLQIDTSGTRVAGLAASSNLSIAPAADQVRVGSTTFRMEWDGTDPYLIVDSDDYMVYDRSTDVYRFNVDGGAELQIEDGGIRTPGIAISNALSLAPGANGIYIGSSTFHLSWDGTDPHINFDGILGVKDELWYDRSQNLLYFNIGGSTVWRGESTGTRSVGIAVSDDLSITPTLDQIRCGHAGFRMQWNGTDPFLYWDTTTNGDYFTYDRSSNGLFLAIADDYRWSCGAAGVRTLGLAVSSSLAVSPVANSIAIGDADFNLKWDGTDPYLYFDDDDYIWYDISGTSIYAVIGTTDRVRIGTVGTRLQGLSIESGLGVTPTADQVRVGDANFRLEFDGTDPYIYFDTVGVNDYLWFDRSANRLYFFSGLTRHSWGQSYANIYGSNADSSSILTSPGDYTYGRYSGMWTLRGPNNSGGADANQIKALQNTLYNNIHPSGTLTNAQSVDIIDVTFNLEQVRNKTFRVTIWGNVKRVSGTNPFLVTGTLTGASSVGMGVMSFAPTSTSGVHDNQDKFHAQFLVPVQGESAAETFHCSLTGAYRIGATVTPVLDHTTGSPEDLVANRLQMQIQLQTTGTGVVDYEVCNAMVEELGGEENQDSE